MDRIVAQLDHEYFYLYDAPAYGDGMPGGAREEFPPNTPLVEHHRWRWNGGKYEATPDYRGTLVYRTDSTSYYPDVWGPLPDGDSITPPPPPPPTLEEQQAAMQAQFVTAIQEYLDTFAKTRNYDGIMSAATYATSTMPKFRAEGQYAVEARDTIWAKGYEILGAVMAGQRAMPSLEEVIAELPVLTWPEV